MAVAALARRPRLIAHVGLETYSVLTRLAPPHRASGAIAAEFLTRNFAEAPLTLPSQRYRTLVVELSTHGITGGGAYDALVGATAADADAELLSLDERARRTYEAMGVRFTMLGRPG